MTHENIQNLPTDITIYMLHVLQQYAKTILQVPILINGRTML